MTTTGAWCRAREGCGEGVDVVGGLAAEAGQERVGGDRPDHGPRLGLVEGGGAEGHVLEGLGEDAAEPEHDDRSEHRVALHAWDGLHASGDHRRDEAAADRRVREGGAVQFAI